MTTALITGITGQDGIHLSTLLRSKGYRVIGASRTAGDRHEALPDVELFRLDVTSGVDDVTSLLRETKPSELYHLAAQSSVGVSFAEPVETFHSIATGTLNVLEAVRRTETATRVLVAASCEVFGDTGGTPAREDTSLRPLNPYSAAKAAAVHLTRSYRASYGLYASAAFFYNHESPLRDGRFVTKRIVRSACRIARGLEQGLELGDITVVRDWGWSPEFMDAAFRILQLDAPEDFVIATGESISLTEFIDAAFAQVGLQFRDHVTTKKALFRPVDIPSMHADPRRAAERLGFRAEVRGGAVARRLVDAELEALDRELGHSRATAP